MKWIGERISYVDQSDKTTFVITPPKLGFQRYLMLVWLVLWLAIGIYVSFELNQDYEQQQKIMLIIFLSFWLYFFVRVGRAMLYVFFGREFIKIDEHSLTIKRATGKYGKSQSFLIENITKLQTVELKENSFQAVYEASPWVAGTNKISFKYFEKTFSFGKKLNDKDAKLLFSVLVNRVEKYIKQKNKKRGKIQI